MKSLKILLIFVLYPFLTSQANDASDSSPPIAIADDVNFNALQKSNTTGQLASQVEEVLFGMIEDSNIIANSTLEDELAINKSPEKKRTTPALLKGETADAVRIVSNNSNVYKISNSKAKNLKSTGSDAKMAYNDVQYLVMKNLGILQNSNLNMDFFQDKNKKMARYAVFNIC